MQLSIKREILNRLNRGINMTPLEAAIRDVKKNQGQLYKSSLPKYPYQQCQYYVAVATNGMKLGFWLTEERLIKDKVIEEEVNNCYWEKIV